MQDPFFQYPRTVAPTSAGDVEMPILYFDCSNLMALFFVDPDKAAPFVSKDAFDLVLFGGKAMVAVAFYEYRTTSIADYKEVGVAIAVKPRGAATPRYPLRSLMGSLDKHSIGFEVINLPVTTEAACAAGRDIWGYPKFVTEIDFSLNGRDFRGSVNNPDGKGSIVSLSGRLGIGVPAPLLDLALYSVHNGQTLRALANTRGGGTLSLPGSLKLEIRSSEHSMARNLAALGLAGKTPAFVSRTDRLQLRLNLGAAI
jgi:hypothetical protein